MGRVRAPAWPWQGPGIADPDPDAASGEGIWIPRSSHGIMGGDAREEATPAVLIFTPSLFFLLRKTHYWASAFFLSTSVPSKLLSQGSAGASLIRHSGSCPCASTLGEWELPLLTPSAHLRGHSEARGASGPGFPSSQPVPGSSCPSLWLRSS